MIEMLRKYYKKDKSVLDTCIKCVLVAWMYALGHAYFPALKYLAIVATFALFLIDYKELFSIILFFIPIASIMKLSPNGMTFLNLAIMAALLLFFVINKGKVGASEFLIGISVVVLLLFKNLLDYFGLPLSYIRIAILLVLVPQCFIAIKEKNIKVDIQKIAVIAFCGIVISSIIGAVFVDNKVLSEYISSEDTFYFGEEIISRFCGLSSDPNYFSSLVIFALSLQFYCLAKYNKIRFLMFAIILSFLGILSYSKMFLLVSIMLWIIGLISVAKVKYDNKKNRNRKRFIVFVSVICMFAVGFYLIESGAIEMLLSRFNGDKVSSITTGRSEIWEDYLNTIIGSGQILLVGANSNSAIVGIHVTHNTFIQVLWKLGLIGFFLVLGWFIYMQRKAKQTVSFAKSSFWQTLVVFLGFILPLFALDKFFFDELYWYFIVYLLCRMDFQQKEKEKNE